jgi:hypothetical protein
VNLGVHDDSVDADLSEHILRVLEQTNPNTPLTEFFLYKVDVFKSRLASSVVQVRLYNENCVPNQLSLEPARNAPEHTGNAQSKIRVVIRF